MLTSTSLHNVFQCPFHLWSSGSVFEEFMVIVDYKATAESELSVKAGEIVKVIKKDETGTVRI